MPLPPWKTNGDEITLYHGTLWNYAKNIEAKGVLLSECKDRKDFGRGFYLTTRRHQSVTWARGARYSPEKNPHYDVPAVVAFTIPWLDLSRLESLMFVLDDRERFWPLVKHCRAWPPTPEGKHLDPLTLWYDLAVGPVAKRWQKDETASWTGYDQYSFHTDKAIGVLNSVLALGAPKFRYFKV